MRKYDSIGSVEFVLHVFKWLTIDIMFRRCSAEMENYRSLRDGRRIIFDQFT